MDKTAFFGKIQQKLAKKVITKNMLPKRIRNVCGVDVSYQDNIAHCSATIFKKTNVKLIESVTKPTMVTFPYISGLFMLREAKPILATLRLLKNPFDVLLINGHGILHLRKCGLASYIGLVLDKPVIGITKNLMCGTVRKDCKVEFENKILGYQLKRGKKCIYVSIGHKINLKTAVKIVKELTIGQNLFPEPLHLADIYSKKQLHSLQIFA
jgi:deoxyribonuclease V